MPKCRWLIAILVSPALLLASPVDDPPRAGAAVGVTTLASVDSAGNQGDGNSTSGEIAGNGSAIAFGSAATNLVPGDTNGALDVFVRDLGSGLTQRVSVSSAEAQGDGDSTIGRGGNYLSTDSRYVVFESDATNLVAGDTNGIRDVFLRDRFLGTTERVSVSATGVEGNGVSDRASVSANGWVVVFRSDADNLVAGDTNAAQDIFVRDRALGTTTRIAAGGISSTPNISDDGRYVVWACCFSGSPSADLFVHDRQTGVTTQLTSGIGSSENPRISGDGRYIVFDSSATNFGPVDQDGFTRDIYLYDQQTQQFELVSKNAASDQSLEEDIHPDISADGRFIVFGTLSSIFDPDDFDGRDIVLVDRQAGTVEQLTTREHLQTPRVSNDGTRAIYWSSRCESVIGDTNGFGDVFLHQINDPGPTQFDTDCDGVPDVPGLAPMLATTVAVDTVELPGVSNRGTALVVNPETNRVYVVSAPEDKVSVIDGATNTIVDAIPTATPWAVAVDTVTDRLWVASREGTVSAFDSNDHSFIATIPVGWSPSDIAVNETLGRVYVANESSGTVSVIDSSTNTVAATLSAGPGPVTLVVNPPTDAVYVAQYLGDSLTKIVDNGTNQFTVTTVSGLPQYTSARQMDADPLTGTVYFGESELVAIDGTTDEITSLGAYGSGVAVDAASGIVYTPGDGGLFLLDRSTHSVLAKGHLPGSGFMAVNPNTGVLYALSGPSGPSEIYVYDVDSDTDGLADVVDNCPADANANQDDLDLDGSGDICDPDVDGDGIANESDPDDDNDGAYDAEGMCGADEFDPTKQPERVDGVFAGVDDDGDGETDEALPGGSAAHDCDGDGYPGTTEMHVFGTGGDQDPCGNGAWPSDLSSTAGGPLDSFNKVNVLDVTSFISPVKYLGTDVGTNAGDVRWDLSPGQGIFATDINVQDLTMLIAGQSAYPPMLGGAKALGGPPCPWPP